MEFDLSVHYCLFIYFHRSVVGLGIVEWQDGKMGVGVGVGQGRVVVEV